MCRSTGLAGLVVMIAAAFAYGDSITDCTIGWTGSPLGGTVDDDQGDAVAEGTDVTVRFRDGLGGEDSRTVTAGAGGHISVDVPVDFTDDPFNFTVQAGGTESDETPAMKSWSSEPWTLGYDSGSLVPYGTDVWDLVNPGDMTWDSVDDGESPHVAVGLNLSVTYGDGAGGVFDVTLTEGTLHFFKDAVFELMPGYLGQIDVNASAFDLVLTSESSEIFWYSDYEYHPWGAQGCWSFSGALEEDQWGSYLTGPVVGFIVPEPTCLALCCLSGLLVARRRR